MSGFHLDQRVQHRDDTQYILGTITEVIADPDNGTRYRVRWDEGWDLYEDGELKPAPEES